LDNPGSVYVTGFFNDTMRVDGVTLTNAGLSDAFLAKHNADGTLVWLKPARSKGADIAHAIVLDSMGSIAIVGEFLNTARFDSHSIVATSGFGDIFIAKAETRLNWKLPLRTFIFLFV
jgi:hypothetical protein